VVEGVVATTQVVQAVVVLVVIAQTTPLVRLFLTQNNLVVVRQ
jgi:hypothetical protein